MSGAPGLSQGPNVPFHAELLAYYEAEARLAAADPLNHVYRPHEAQELLHLSGAKRRILIASNRSGKTTSAMCEVLWNARGWHPYREVPLQKQIWIGCPDYPSYVRYLRPTFDQWCPPSWRGDFHETDKYVDITRVDGRKCRLFFLSYDMPRSKWQGAAVDGVLLDEECPEDLYGECVARVASTSGWVLLTFTAVSGLGWWHDRIWKGAWKGRDADGVAENGWWAGRAALAERDDTQPYSVGRVLVPHFTRAMVVDFAKDIIDDTERGIRVFGEVRGRAGLVYAAFAPDVHLVPEFEIPAHWQLWGGIDPGYHGFAVVVCAADELGRTYIVHETFSQAETARTRMGRIREALCKIRKSPEPVVFFVDTEDPQVVLELNTLSVEIAESGAAGPIPLFASLDQGKKARKAGITRVQELLQPRVELMTPLHVSRPRPQVGEPALYLFDTLESRWQEGEKVTEGSRLAWELERYSWKRPPRGSTVQPDDAEEKSAGGSHMLAATRYSIMARMGESEPAHGRLAAPHLDAMSTWVAERLAEQERQWALEHAHDGFGDAA